MFSVEQSSGETERTAAEGSSHGGAAFADGGAERRVLLYKRASCSLRAYSIESAGSWFDRPRFAAAAAVNPPHLTPIRAPKP